MKDLAIVILNWNGRAHLEEFLPSVIKFSEGSRIILADNASSDDSILFVKENFPSVELLYNDTNEGFAKGYNEVLKRIESKYFLLLNNDIEVTEGWLKPLLQVMEDDQVAGCQPKIRSYHNREYFEHAGASGGFLDKNYFPFCRGRIFNAVEKDEGQYDESREIFWASGAALLIRSELFHQVGGFDEDFFAHMEEIDLCWRIKKLNYSFMVVPQSIVYHVGGGTLPYSSPKKVYLNFRNSLMMTAKNHSGPIYLKLISRLFIDGLAAVKFLLGGNVKNFIAVFNAHMWHHGNIRTILKKRKKIKKSTVKFNSKGLYDGSIIWAYYFKGIKQFSKLNQRLFE